MLKDHGYGVIFFAVVFVILIVIAMIEYVRSYKVDKAKKMILAHGPFLVFNVIRGVMAVCRYSDMQKALRDWEESFEKEKDEEKKKELSVKKIVVEVFPTFTFTADLHRLKAHTGSDQDFERLLEHLVHYNTGRSLNSLVDHPVDSGFRSSVIVEDKRLFVPFSSFWDKAERDRQIKVHGCNSLEMATDELVVANR